MLKIHVCSSQFPLGLCIREKKKCANFETEIFFGRISRVDSRHVLSLDHPVFPRIAIFGRFAFSFTTSAIRAEIAVTSRLRDLIPRPSEWLNSLAMRNIILFAQYQNAGTLFKKLDSYTHGWPIRKSLSKFPDLSKNSPKPVFSQSRLNSEYAKLLASHDPLITFSLFQSWGIQ